MRQLAIFLIAALLWIGADWSASSSGLAQAHGRYHAYYYPGYYPGGVVVAPAPVVVMPVAPAVIYQPAARVMTRYRPFLGRSVTRVRYGYGPVVLW
jgi:hypothetical protein